MLDGADVDVLIENEGTLALGNSAGQTSGLAYIQSNQGEWILEIGGTGLNDFDHMTLSDTASLDGTLDLSLIMEFAPSLGDTFSILSAAGGVSGAFASLLQPGAMPAGLMFDVNYFSTIVQLEVVAAPLPGDYNQDGIVDAADYTVWRDHLGSAAVLPNDATPGVVDASDYAVWKTNFGNSYSSASFAATANVPEPSTLLLVGIAVSLALNLRRQKNLRDPQ